MSVHTHLLPIYIAHAMISQIWKTSWTPVKVAYLFCRYVGSNSSNSRLNIHRYWVITVVPYLLYAFVINHSLETCQRIYKVNPTSGANHSMYDNNPHQIPVALAMWNQVGSECALLRSLHAGTALSSLPTRSCPADSDLRLLQPK